MKRSDNKIWYYGKHAINETLYYLDQLTAWHVNIDQCRDEIVGLMQDLNRFVIDIDDYLEGPCKSCEIKSCPWRPDSTEECIYYGEQNKEEE